MRATAIGIWLLLLGSCARNPEHFVEKGDVYFNRGRYTEAFLLYRSALKADGRFALAYYKLALTDLQVGQFPGAVRDLRRAVELLPPTSAEASAAKVKLAELYLIGWGKREDLDEAKDLANQSLERDPNSYDGHRLSAEWLYVRARQAYAAALPDEGAKLLDTAIEEYRKADRVRPGQLQTRLPLARSLAAAQRYTESEDIYRQALGENRNPIVYPELYQIYMLQKRFADAEKLLQSAIAGNPREYRYLLLLAVFYNGQNRPGDMVRALNQIHAQSQNAAAYAATGDFYLRLGKGENAIREYQAGMRVDPKRQAYYRKRIIEVLLRQGKRAEAAKRNDEILKDNPKDADARALEATTLLDRGDLQTSMQELQSVVAKAPKNFVAFFNLGRAYAARREYEQALAQYSAAIRLRRDYMPARLALAQLQLTLGYFASALQSAAEAAAVDPSNPMPPLLECPALTGLKRYAEAEQLIATLRRQHPESAEVLFQAGATYLADHKYKEAEEVFRKLQEMKPADPRGVLGVNEIYFAEKKPDRAIELLQQQVRKYPYRSDYRVALATAAARAGQYDLAVSEYQNVIGNSVAGSEFESTVCFRLAEAYRRQGDLENSAAALKQALKGRPADPAILGALGETLEKLGRQQDARPAYEQCLRADPNNVLALNNLAFLMARNNGDLDQALNYAQRARQLAPQFPEISDTLGMIYLKKQLTDSALDVFRALVYSQPASALYRYHLGMAYAQKGDKAEAAQELQAALRSNPAPADEDGIRRLLRYAKAPAAAALPPHPTR